MTFDDRPIQSHRDPDHTSRGHDATDPSVTRVSGTSDTYDDLSDVSSDAEATRSDEKRGSVVREIIETLLLALIIFVAVRSVVLNFRVDGLSMTPSLEDNEMLLVNRNVYFNFDTWAIVDWLPGVEHEEKNVVYPFHPPERGDIIVFDAPVNGASKPYIKRVIGLPGETVEIRDNHVYINGQQLEEPYLEGAETFCSGQRACPEVTVPEGSVYVLGDNRDNSQDSRVFGPVDVDSIIGKAWVTYWPTDEIGVVPHFDYPEIADEE